MSLLPLAAILGGLTLLVLSADRFVTGSAALARHLGMSPLLVGMLVIGFGTSAPEMLVSILASLKGNPGLALGNAYGSNIANIALILGLTALVSPIAVRSGILRREVPILLAVTFLSVLLLSDLRLGRFDAIILLLVFALLIGWSIRAAMAGKGDALANELESEAAEHSMELRPAIVCTIAGLIVLIGSSRLLVWGAVETAQLLGVSDLVIGLTIVAVGTSLPELASTLTALRRNEHDIALGNVIGSNLFNTLAVVGLAGVIQPTALPPAILWRDLPVMTGLTIALVVVCVGVRGPGRVNRIEGAALLVCFVAYTAFVVSTALKRGAPWTAFAG